MKFSYSKFSLANMQTIVTLIFLGYLGCTFACYDDLPEDCRDLEDEAMFPFSADSFFQSTKHWYVTHSKNQGSNPECSKFETSKLGKINLKYHRGGQKFECTGDEHAMNKHICFDCEGSGSTGEFQKFFLVLEADSYYADYALVYVCNDSETRTTDNFLVLQRTKSNSVPSGISSALSEVGLKSSDLKSYNCK